MRWMSAASTISPAPAGIGYRLPVARIGVLVVLVLVLSATLGTAAGRAATAPEQWQPATPDLVRTLRSCPVGVSAPTPPVCWSITENASAWMAQPPSSPYPWGQCTYYAALMRSDIWNDRAPPSIDPLNDWDAWTWVQHAQAEGLSVSGDPQPGDVMVYSRAAVGNNTGHVAIVDAVGGTDPATGDLEVIVSEMNVDGLDDASLGQGDTMTVLLPRSELVPGMIQFIHQPGAGYVAPAWPDASNAGGPGPAAPGGTPQNPSLGVGLFGDHVQTVSESPAPVQATVTALPAGTVVKRLSLAANRDVALQLPTGTYQVCVSQAATGQWAAAGDCISGSWQAPAVRATIRLGAIRATGKRLTLAVVLGPRAALNGDAALTARILVSIARPGRRGHRAITAAATYRVTSNLHAGRQVVALPVQLSRVRHAVLSVTVAAVSADGAAMGSARASVRVR